MKIKTWVGIGIGVGNWDGDLYWDRNENGMGTRIGFRIGLSRLSN